MGSNGLLGGRFALVTGSSGGIGSAICREFAAAGADVALHYHTSHDRVEALAQFLRQAYPERRFPVFQADLRSQGDVDLLFDGVLTTFDDLHILVNNAGINRDRTLKRAAIEEWLDVIDVNLLGHVLCARRAAQHLQSGGRIINISSIIAFTGNFGQSNYAAAKAGLIGFTKSLAAELGPSGITVNAIAPGFVDTPMTAAMPEKYRALWEQRAALGRFATPEEIAWPALFLAAPRASYVNGTVIHVNGGAY